MAANSPNVRAISPVFGTGVSETEIAISSIALAARVIDLTRDKIIVADASEPAIKS